jgi:NADH dehydrogenase
MQPGKVVVFGGTGFLGRRVVAGLTAVGAQVRVASRQASAVGGWPGVAHVVSDIRDPASVERALTGAVAAVNCVSLYREAAGARFHDIHVSGAASLARAARGLQLVQISGIGADPAARSPYIRARGQGELAVREASSDAVILRPSVMFGPDDAFLNALDRITRLLPVIPLFGDGATRLQPVHVDDVAAAVVRAIERPDAAGRVFELGGPEVLTYREILERLLRRAGRRRLLMPLPFAVWSAIAAATSRLPMAPVTEGQVALMKRDNVVSPDAAGFAALGLTPRPLETGLRS